MCIAKAYELEIYGALFPFYTPYFTGNVLHMVYPGVGIARCALDYLQTHKYFPGYILTPLGE